MANEIPSWPALDLAGHDLPAELRFSRGVWGKAHGVASDYRWLAASPDFRFSHDGLERQLIVGAEDEPARFHCWRPVGDFSFAVVAYPSQARDAAGRRDFLEKQVLAWRRPDTVPAALAALLLLSHTAAWNDDVWWEERSRAEFERDLFVLELTEEPALQAPIQTLERAIEHGIRELVARLGEDGLRQLFARLLAGGRAVPATGVGPDPLPPEALAALLLPFPRSTSDRLALAGALPARRFDRASLAEHWDFVAHRGDGAPPDPPPSPSHEDRAARMVDALMARDPGLLESAPAAAVGGGAEGDVQIALWGPSAAGKTALIAQLYLFILEPGSGIDWEILPDEKSFDFIQRMREVMYGRNQFPKATGVGTKDEIVYHFHHRHTGKRASMLIEDRAGVDFENLHPEAQERLRAAAGLVLLFDPIRAPVKLELEVSRTLEKVHVSRGDGGKDARPIAVCVSKADELIASPADYDRAIENPANFVRDKVDSVLVRTLDRFCTHYELFPVSSAGLKLVHGAVKPTVFYDETLEPRLGRGGEPLNLMAPFAWVLNEVTRS